MKNHYSLFRCQDPDGYTRVINLDAICHISIEPSQTIDAVSYWVFLLDGEAVLVDAVAGEALLKAWNVFLAVKHATHYVLRQVDPYGANTTAIKSCLRIEQFLVNEIQALQILEEEQCQ